MIEKREQGALLAMSEQSGMVRPDLVPITDVDAFMRRPIVSLMPVCNRCGASVLPLLGGCKQPCMNCGTVYPLGDCSD